MSKTNRRTFLKTSAAAAGALAANLALTGGVHAEGNGVIKVGLIGCGSRGSGAAGDCLEADPNVKLHAVADAFPDRAKGLVGRFNDGDLKKQIDVGDRVFIGLDGYKEVIKACDLIILATPPGFRPTHIEAVIAAKKHLFTEKPCAVDGQGVKRVLKAYEDANAAKLCVVAGTQRRHQKGYLESMKRVHGGDIGEIISARCYWNQGKLWHRKREKGMTDLEWQIRNWLYFTALSGDHICEQHVHNLDVINWALKDHPMQCQGMGGRQTRTAPEFGHIFDHFAIEYTYLDGQHLLSMCRQIDDCANDISEWLHGTKGVWGTPGHNYEMTGPKPWKMNTKKEDNKPYKQEHVDLIRHIREGKQINELKNVAESTLTAIMGRMAAYTGEVVTWAAALDSKEMLLPRDLAMDMKFPVPEVARPGITKLI
jgi:predicted dehydrogenase